MCYVFGRLVSNITGSISGSGTISVASGAVLQLGTTGGASPYVTGSITNVVNNGTIALNGGTSLDVTSAVDSSSSGIFQLNAQSALEIGAYLGTNLKIQFLAGRASLTIDNAAQFGVNVGSTSYAGPLI